MDACMAQKMLPHILAIVGMAVALGQVASARMTEDEARRALARVVGVSLEGWRSRVEHDTICFFQAEPGRGVTEYRANLETGAFGGYSQPFPEWAGQPEGAECPEPLVSADQAERAGRDEAKRWMGDAYSRITEWAVESRAGEGYYAVRGHGDRRGEPPRDGLSPWCSAFVSCLDAKVFYYGQTVPVEVEPIDPVVSAERALEIARKHMEEPDARVLSEPWLWQSPQGKRELKWTFAMGFPAAQEEPGNDTRHVGHERPARLYEIDALTGDILLCDIASGFSDRAGAPERALSPAEGVPEPSAASVVPSAEPAPEAGGTPAVPVVPLAGAGVVLVLGVAAVMVVRRRR